MQSKTELQNIPGVGKTIEQDLMRLGYYTISSYADKIQKKCIDVIVNYEE